MQRKAAAFARWHEPDDARVSSPDLWEARGAIPRAYSARSAIGFAQPLWLQLREHRRPAQFVRRIPRSDIALSMFVLSGRSQMTDLQEDRQSRPLGIIKGSPKNIPRALSRASRLLFGSAGAPLCSLVRPRRLAPSLSAAWHRASRRAVRCGQPACAGQW